MFMTMTPNLLKNIFSKTSTRNYPFTTRPSFEQYRGELVNNIEECIFCGICSRKCPAQCIEVNKKTGSWECDPFMCVYCGVCVDNCPTKCLSQKQAYRAPASGRDTMLLQGTPPKKKPTKKQGA